MVALRHSMFRFIVMAVLLAFLSLGSNAINPAFQNQALDLMPVPKKISLGQGWLGIDFGFRVALTGYTEPSTGLSNDWRYRREYRSSWDWKRMPPRPFWRFSAQVREKRISR